MDQTLEVTPDEVMNLYRDGQKRGFIAGVIFCVAAKYMYDRRKELPIPKDSDLRTRN